MKFCHRSVLFLSAFLSVSLPVAAQSNESQKESYPATSQGATILRPKSGTLVHPGDTLQIDAVLDEGVSPVKAIAVLSDMGVSENYRESPPYSFTFRVPLGDEREHNPLLGFHDLSVFGTVIGRKNFDLASIEVDVEESELPVELFAAGNLGSLPSQEPNPNTVNFYRAGSDESIRIYGRFADGRELDVTHSTYLTISSSDPSVARVPTNETITSIGPGRTKVVVIYRLGSEQKQLDIPVYVKIPQAVLVAEPGFIDFDDQPVGTKSAPRIVNITNKLDRPVSIGELKVYGFDIEAGNCANQKLPEDGSCSISISFAPSRPGPTRAVLEIPNEYDHVAIPLSGKAN